jgi:trk system potassium uptake protein TrkA
MYIVIAGAGLVGMALAEKLMQSKHDVVIIDIKREVCEEAYRKLGAMTIEGSASSIDTLEEAGIRKADVAVGLMRLDADNLAFAVLAKSANVPRIITRMRDPRFEPSFQTIGVTKLVNIVDLYVGQLALEIEEPTIQRVATIGGGRAAIAIFQLPEGSEVAGKTIAEVAGLKGFPEDLVFAGIYREEEQEFIIPRGNRKLLAGDRLFLAADTEDLRRAAKFMGVKGKI